MRLLERLAALELLVITGKGGVGKTVVACALGHLLAARGRRCLVLEVDPRENVHQMLGVEPSGGAVVPAGPRLWAQNLKPGNVLDEIVRERLRLEFLIRRVLDSPVYAQFSAGAPGLKELAILGHALRLLRGTTAERTPEIDCVLLDAPATGHGLRLLAAPRLVSEVITGGPFGQLAAELARWVADPAAVGVVVAAQAEDMPVTEALELRDALAEWLATTPVAAIVNGLYPPVPAALGIAASGTPEALWAERRRVNERELDRLRAAWGGPLLELPLLPLDRGPALVATLSECLRAALEGAVMAGGVMDLLGEKHPLLLVVGSGGVGKTTLAAALGVASAGAGHRTLVMTFDPSARLKQTLGVGDEAREQEMPVPLAGAAVLAAHLLDARRTFDRLVSRYAPDPAASERVLGNRFYQQLSGNLGGILEYMAVERLYEVASAGRYDRVILDTPPTRQALDFLEAPERIVGFLDSGALKIALRPWFDEEGRLRATARFGPLGRRADRFLDETVGLDLLRDMAEFFQAFAPLYAGFRERALHVAELLRSPRTRFVLVTGPGEERVADTLFFARRLEQAGYRLGPLIVNRVHPRWEAAVPRSDGDRCHPAGPALLAWLGERDARVLQSFRDLLPDRPLIDLPLLPDEPTDLAALGRLGRSVVERLAALKP